MKYEVERLAPGDINEDRRRIICGLLVNGAEFRSRGEPNIAEIMGGVYKANTAQTLRETASREDSGLYVARQGGIALAATIISLQERPDAPHYNNANIPNKLMYMGHFGVSTNDGTWRDLFTDIVGRARSDFGDKEVAGLGAYVSIGDDNELPEAVRRLNPKTYKVFGEEAGVDGYIDGVPGRYRLHTVEFTKGIGRAGLFGSAKKFLTDRFSHLGGTELSPTRPAPAAPKREKVPVAA